VQAAARYDWHTVRGTREDAKALERKYENAKKNDEYIGRPERKTFEEVANLFLDDRRAKNRRVSTLEEYQTELKLRLLPQPNEKLPPLGPRNIRNIQRADMKVHFNSLRNRVCTISQVNKVIKAAKAIFATATPFELGLFGTLSISGPRPGEIYALEWPEVYLDVEKPYFRIVRTWCSKGFRFYTPKTEAGRRTVPISAWLAAVLREHRASSCGVGLVFALAGVSESVAGRVG